MFLNIYTHNIKYVRSVPYDKTPFTATTLKNIIITQLLNENPDQDDSHINFFRTTVLNLVRGLYLGDENKLREIINKNLYKGSINHIKNIYPAYFSSSYLNFLNPPNISKTEKIEESDMIIIGDVIFNNYVGMSKVSEKGQLNTVLIMYSEREDCYYIIDQCMTKIYSFVNKKQFDFGTEADESEKFMLWAKELIANDILPPDCMYIYFGKIACFYSIEKLKCAEFMLNSIIPHMYLRDFEKEIKKSLPDVTDDNIRTIETMLKSEDESTISIALHSLLSFNIFKRPMSISYLIYENYKSLKNYEIIHSKECEYLFYLLGIDTTSLRFESFYYFANKLCENNPDACDKDFLKEKVIRRLREDMEYKLDETMKIIPYFNIKYKFKIT